MGAVVADFTAAEAGVSTEAVDSKGAADLAPAAVVDLPAAHTLRAPDTPVLVLLRRTRDVRTAGLRAAQVTNTPVPATVSPVEASARGIPHRQPRWMADGIRLAARRVAGKPPGAADLRPAEETSMYSAATARLVDRAVLFAVFRARVARSGRIRPRPTMSFLDLNRFRRFTIHSVDRLPSAPLRVPVRRYPRRAVLALRLPWARGAFRAV